MEPLRAVIYCRCSTEEESQADALRNQVLESEACVREQGWLLTDRYVELKSGTTTRGRGEYNRLFDDLMTDKFDIIVIKSQDRLMRNVKDWYLFLDRMLKRGKRLFMYIEHKFYSADDALVTGIKAILAEEYSRELSKKINNAHRHRQTRGGKVMVNSRTFGFVKLPDGSVEVVKEEAEIIRKIFEYSAAGYGSRSIAGIFRNQGFVKRTGTPLTATAVGRIIRNPLYKGVMVMNRRHYDFETKKTEKVPEDQWIRREGAVPAIVDPKLWNRANQAMTDRGASSGRRDYKKGNSKGMYDLSGKIVCGQCGRVYYRTWRHGRGGGEQAVIEWKCGNYLENGRKEPGAGEKGRNVKKEFCGGCDGIHLEEKAVFQILEQVSQRYYPFSQQDRDKLLDQAMEILRKILGETPEKQEQERIRREEKKLAEQKEFLLTKFLEGVISDRDYRKRADEMEKAAARLMREEEKLKQRGRGQGDSDQRIEAVRARLEDGGMKKAIGAWMLWYIREIQVHEWQLEIRFDPLRLAEWVRDGQGTGDSAGEPLPENLTIWVDYPFGPETGRGRCLDRRRILEQIRKDPAVTARRLAGEMGRSVCMTRRRMEELVKGGYIRFNGKGGHGVWEILRELPDKEESMKTGGL